MGKLWISPHESILMVERYEASEDEYKASKDEYEAPEDEHEVLKDEYEMLKGSSLEGLFSGGQIYKGSFPEGQV